MLHHIIISSAAAIRFARSVIFRLLLILALLGLNIATVVSDAVYDSLNRIVWGTLQLVSEQIAERRPKARADIDADLVSSRTELAGIKATVLKKQNELEAALAETALVRRELNNAMKLNNILSTELGSAKLEAASMATEIDIARKARSEAVNTASVLRSRIVQSIRRNASTEAIAAVPFIGTAVALGSVAYDLNDACYQLRELEALEAILRDREPEQITEAMCLLSYEDMVAAVTGQDPGYARCVSDRKRNNELNPPSCAGYEPAVPPIYGSPLSLPEASIETPPFE
jgi:hypothetical protein